ncbi:MAG: thioredoxin family protein [Actinomycetota bacterium]|nr:thioredoxin family protein [Actinomycetota bacterium]
MNLTVLHVEGCPSLEPLVAELKDLVGSRTDITLTTVLVTSVRQASRLGFHGSPTILIDGVDPFPSPTERIGLSCRVYADSTGRLAGLPSRTSLATALGMNS